MSKGENSRLRSFYGEGTGRLGQIEMSNVTALNKDKIQGVSFSVTHSFPQTLH